MDYSNIHEVVGWISGSVKSYRNKIATADKTINDIEEAILKYTTIHEKEIEKLQEELNRKDEE